MSLVASLAAFSALLGTNALPPDTHVYLNGTNQPFWVERYGVSLCFAPDTNPDYVRKMIERLPKPPLRAEYQFFNSPFNRWTSTAAGSTGAVGNPIVLTYSFVPDGTTLTNGIGEPAAPSSLTSAFNAAFGANDWKAKIRAGITQWNKFAAITYTEVTDDGASSPTNVGRNAAPIRGDVRIAGHPIDGAFNILAYNFSPNSGDMIIDTNDASFFANTTSDFIRLRNTMAHEHGHGLGFAHVDPTDNSKLMEAFLNTNFDGPQDDDIRAVQRNYGDRYENNDTLATAKSLGTANPAVTVDNLATDASGDQDWYRVTVDPARSLSIDMVPVGRSYLQGPQGGATATVDTLRINKLCIDVYANDGTTLLARRDAAAKGVTETISGLNVAAAGATVVLKIYNANTVAFPVTDDVQRYKLTLDNMVVGNGTVAGNVALQSIVNPAVSITFEFRPQPSGTAFTRTVTLDASGNYSLANIPAGSYNVAVKGGRWLQRTTSLTVAAGVTNTFNVALRGGDSNNSNVVDINDLNLLIGRYNQVSGEPGSLYSVTVDFDNDGTININDLLLLISNFNVAGDP